VQHRASCANADGSIEIEKINSALTTGLPSTLASAATQPMFILCLTTRTNMSSRSPGTTGRRKLRLVDPGEIRHLARHVTRLEDRGSSELRERLDHVHAGEEADSPESVR